MPARKICHRAVLSFFLEGLRLDFKIASGDLGLANDGLERADLQACVIGNRYGDRGVGP